VHPTSEIAAAVCTKPRRVITNCDTKLLQHEFYS
jgi:hypothetical protein